jgi:phenylpropionate dioxygenase-like ring-hydroxylating dioxygenase large terminal subunit
MRRERQREIVRTILDLAAVDGTQLADAPLVNPVSDYVSPEVFAAERQRLFRERPVLACLSADLREPGDCYATESGGVPFVVLRHPDGSARAYVNICRHRGSPLVDPGPGHLARSLRCGFHGWTYDLDGAVIARPHSTGGFDGLDDAGSALIPCPSAEAHGLVLVRPVGDAPVDLDEVLVGMGDELDEFGFGAYHHFDEWVSEWAGNWKLLVDTFLETYHVPALHPDTVARHFIVRPSVCAAFGPNIRFHSLMKTVLGLRERPEPEWELLPHGTVEYLVSPAAVLNYSVDHLALYRFLPLAVDRTRVVLTLYTPTPVHQAGDGSGGRAVDHAADPAAAEHYRRTLALHQRVSGGQDFTKQEQIQRALSSGALPHVVYGRNEPAVIHFHRSLSALLA